MDIRDLTYRKTLLYPGNRTFCVKEHVGYIILGAHIMCVCTQILYVPVWIFSQIAKFMGPTWGPPGSCRPQVGPMLATWTLLSGFIIVVAFRAVTHRIFLVAVK